MERRELLRYTAYLTGYAVTAPIASAILSGCQADAPAQEVGGYAPVFFAGSAYAVMCAMAETMLPRTNTPGAADVGVPQFADVVIGTFTEEKHKKRIRAGFDNWLAKHNDFADLSAEAQLEQLDALDTEAKAEMEKIDAMEDLTDDEKDERQPWWIDVKSVMLAGFFSSEQIGTEHLAYDPVPGEYKPCMPLEETAGKAWSL